MDDNWMPIDTAPKDGSIIILYDTDVRDVVTGFWCPPLSAWVCTCHRCSDGSAAPSAEPSFVHRMPTHWMSLPTPPKSK